MATITNDARPSSIPEARYAYYRRCQVFRRNGEQCKAPAGKGAHICYAHAGQQAMQARRERERREVLEEVVLRMQRGGRPEFAMADIPMDFNAIQVTIAVAAQALIDGRIDCQTAGRLAVELQTFSKLLWMSRRLAASPQVYTEDRRPVERPGCTRLPVLPTWADVSMEKDAVIVELPGKPAIATGRQVEAA